MTRLTAIAAAAALVAPALADHIPGHSDGDPVFPVPIPGQDHFSGGIAFVTAIGPNGGSRIYNTRFDITFVSDGVTPASNMLIEVGMHIENDAGAFSYRVFELTGADLGFTSGPGAFHGTLETHTFNGTAVESFFFPPYSIVDLTLGATTGGIDGTGYFENSFIYFDLVPSPGTLSILGLAAIASRRRRSH